MNINIVKAEFKGYAGLAYKYIQKLEDNFENKIDTKSDAPPHNDLRTAFMHLAPHLAFICEEIDKEKCENLLQALEEDFSLNEDFENYNEILDKFFIKFTVDSFDITGKGEKEAIKLSGSKMLNNMMKSISLTTPAIKFDTDRNEYPFIDELIDASQNVRDEVFEYYNGKQAPDNQIELEFEDLEGDEDMPNHIEEAASNLKKVMDDNDIEISIG